MELPANSQLSIIVGSHRSQTLYQVLVEAVPGMMTLVKIQTNHSKNITPCQS